MKDPDARQLVDQIRTDLTAAMKAQNQLEIPTLKSLLASFSNAEAVAFSNVESETTEVARKELTPADLQQITQAEIDELEQTISQINKSNAYVAVLQAKQAVLQRYI